MIKKEIIFPYHLFNRRAAELSQALLRQEMRYCYLEKEGKRVNGKSLLGLLSLGARQGEMVTLICEDKEGIVKMEEIINNLKEVL